MREPVSRSGIWSFQSLQLNSTLLPDIKTDKRGKLKPYIFTETGAKNSVKPCIFRHRSEKIYIFTETGVGNWSHAYSQKQEREKLKPYVFTETGAGNWNRTYSQPKQERETETVHIHRNRSGKQKPYTSSSQKQERDKLKLSIFTETGATNWNETVYFHRNRSGTNWNHLYLQKQERDKVKPSIFTETGAGQTETIYIHRNRSGTNWNHLYSQKQERETEWQYIFTKTVYHYWVIRNIERVMGKGGIFTSYNIHYITPISLHVIVMPTFFQALDTKTT